MTRSLSIVLSKSLEIKTIENMNHYLKHDLEEKISVKDELFIHCMKFVPF